MSVNDGENIISSSSSTSISPTTSAFSSPTPSSDDWIAQFHACYNPIHTEPTTTMMSDNQPPINTSTPVPFNTLPLNREQSRTVLHGVSGVKIYEDMDEVGKAFAESSDDSYEIVAVENNKVIGRATFGTLKSSGTLRSRIL